MTIRKDDLIHFVILCAQMQNEPNLSPKKYPRKIARCTDGGIRYMKTGTSFLGGGGVFGEKNAFFPNKKGVRIRWGSSKIGFKQGGNNG